MTTEQFAFSGARKVARPEIEAEARRLASWLAAKEVGENDTVALLMWNDFPYLSLPRATAMLGAYLVPLNWHLTRAELDYILDDSDAKALIGHSHLLAAAGLHGVDGLEVLALETPDDVRAAYPKQCSGDVAGDWRDWSEVLDMPPYEGDPKPGNRGGIFYTSGTTGNPKGVRRAPLNDEVWATTRARSLTGFGLDSAPEGRAALAPGPLYHSAPNAHATNAWALGLDLVMMPRFDAGQALDLIAQHRISHIQMVPTMFSRLLAQPKATRAAFDPAPLMAVCHGAAPCPDAVKQAMIDWFGPVIFEYYAGTETGVIGCSTSHDWLAHPGTVGKPAGDCVVRVIDDTGAEVAVGQTGRLICHSSSTTSFSYHKRAGSPEVDGWPGFVALGDIGHVDAQGFIYLTDRSADIVISGGVNIYPAEIEKELATLSGVADCVVIGVPMPELSEGIIALVEPAGSPQADDLIAGLKRRVAGYKLPRRIIFVDRLPREDSGKIRKRLLQDDYKDILTGEPT